LTLTRTGTYVSFALTEKHTVTLEIAGARYRMSSDTDEAHLEGLAEVVNERIAALGDKARQKASPAQLLAVVALGLAEDLTVEADRRRELEGRVRDVVTHAIARIDARLDQDAQTEADAGEQA